MSPLPLVSSYLTFSPLPWTYHGGLVSEALSLGLPPLGITQHPALWSSDFPPAASSAAGDHLACFAILWGITNQQLKTIFVILSVAKNLSFKPPRFFTKLSSVQNDMNIHSFLTATS